jgi:hypothetical protein
MHPRPLIVLIPLVLCLAAAEARAQPVPTGHISLLADFFPNRHRTAELRARLFAEEKLEPSSRFRLTLSGFVEGLLARRKLPSTVPGVSVDHDVRRDAVARVHDANVEWRSARADLLAGFARIAWGKLDELQPSDVINPLDVSRFFFEGRSEARLPVALVRGRVFITEDAVIEGVYVPAFRRGRFDQLDEETSPFNLAADLPLPADVIDVKPEFGQPQGGVRFRATAGRVDWSVSAYRGFEPFGQFQATTTGRIERVYPRFTLAAGDFETVRGEWGVRGEVAAFLDDSFQSPQAAVVSGQSFDAGFGVDRRAGEYRIGGTLLFHYQQYDALFVTRARPETSRSDVSVIAAADRSFARERYNVRLFGVYNVSESSGFARGITKAALRDNVALEGSLGWFLGDGRDLVGQFGDHEFLYVRLKYYF